MYSPRGNVKFAVWKTSSVVDNPKGTGHNEVILKKSEEDLLPVEVSSLETWAFDKEDGSSPL